MNKQSSKKPNPKVIKNLPRVVYAASVNLSGLYAKKPMRCVLNEDWFDIDEPHWYSRDGNFDASKLGLDISNNYGHATFASVNKNEVELWISGATSVMALLRSWAHA